MTLKLNLKGLRANGYFLLKIPDIGKISKEELQEADEKR